MLFIFDIQGIDPGLSGFALMPTRETSTTLESKMKKLAMFALSAAVLVSSSAFAQELSRSEVHQQLVQSEQDGLRSYTNASDPVIGSIYQDQAALQQNDADSYGGVAARSAESTARAVMPAAASRDACVGPHSFCDIYAGS
jgi:hypothetical protein